VRLRSGRASRLAGAASALLVLVLVLAPWPAVTYAQPASEAAVKAGFLYNFAKFTDWPESRLPLTAPLVFCVTDKQVADALQTLISGRSIAARRLVVTRLQIDDLMADCALLYVGALEAKRATRLLASLRGASVLSIGDTEGFAEAGGTIQFIRENSRLRFAVNVAAATREQLRRGSQLLALATLVKDRSN
jgi:hypothetical protein